ncbi:hypothetical protein DLJ53_33465 [Acuticoccus sediminis]|uniref:Uncharacterized protein n=1 Tax=Acuticoccus sediminis TaxID=2184697 RepID=A0A8B2NJG5_9HYPH|nr:hypothetical protein [Acuticoccus sediminis]RAH96059.1 hypothetical protein DLJ53_33465 [Acuticoccus sediminis]
MSKYGFGDEEVEPIALPKVRRQSPKPQPEAVRASVEEGRALGFVPREVTAEPPSRPARKPGRRKGEPKSQILISGPARVIDAFRDHCEAGEITYWEAIERWLADRG